MSKTLETVKNLLKQAHTAVMLPHPETLGDCRLQHWILLQSLERGMGQATALSEAD